MGDAPKKAKRKFYPKIDRSKQVTSRFLLTVSPNKKEGQIDGGLESLKTRLGACFRVLEKKESAGRFIYVVDPKGDLSNITSVSCEWALEKGARGILHGHALFQINHNTRVRMQFATYKSFCAKAVGLKSVYFHAKLLPKDTASTLTDVRKYIDKDQHIPADEK